MSAPPSIFPTPDGNWTEYTWIVVCGALSCFYMAWGIGANDVANSFATSVGSKTLKLWEACIIAAVFEFLGAMVLGGETTKTVAADIANISMFKDVPEIYMYGMLCSLAVAGTWLLIATYWCYAVSTTHSIIGAIMGFALVYGGWDGVLWHQEKGDFPYTKGFLPVVLSWFVSPVIGGILCSIIFSLNRFFILRRQNSSKLAIWSIPALLFITIFINLMFVLAKGAKSNMQKTWPCTTAVGYHDLTYTDCSDLNNAAAWIAAVVAAFCAIVGGAIFIPLLTRKLQRDIARREAAAAAIPDVEDAAAAAKAGTDAEKIAAIDGPEVALSMRRLDSQRHESIVVHEIPKEAPSYALPYHYGKLTWTALQKQVVKGLYYDVHHKVDDDATVSAMHHSAEVFNPDTEQVYQYLQVFTACCVAFAHGSNDVANSIGPFSGIYTVYKTWAVPSSSTETEKWIFAFGGVGIVVGLITYGYNIIMELGVTLLKLTPSRGFSTELAAGLTISLASFYGIPVSTTQIIVGCEMGCGLTESLTTGLNFKILFKTFAGWVWTIILALAFCAALFSAGAYAPSILMANEITDYRTALYDTSNQIYTAMAAINNANKANATWWNSTAVKPFSGYTLNQTIVKTNDTHVKAVKEYDSKKKAFTGYNKFITKDQSMWYLNKALALQNQTVTTIIGKA